MKCLFLILCVCILRSQAIPMECRQWKNCKKLSPCLVIRPELVGTDSAALGSISIISTRHVLTAAHVVHGQNNNFQINFFVGTSHRTFKSNFALIHENYDEENFNNDIALIFLQGDNYFSVLNIIRISTANAQSGTVGTVTGYGFTSKQTIGYASLQPVSANQTVTNSCVFEDYEAAPSHFCALDPVTSGIICPGDNGAGYYIKNSTTDENELIGVASRILKGCSEAGYTGYTRISLCSAWINAITNL